MFNLKKKEKPKKRNATGVIGITLGIIAGIAGAAALVYEVATTIKILKEIDNIGLDDEDLEDIFPEEINM